MAEIGEELLRASQQIVQQFQANRSLRNQQIQFEAQLRQADKSFKLREQEIKSREKLVQLQTQELEIRTSPAAVGARQQLAETNLAIKQIDLKKAIAELEGTGAAPSLTPNKRLEIQRAVTAGAFEIRSREISKELAIDENVASLAGRSTDEIAATLKSKEASLRDLNRDVLAQRSSGAIFSKVREDLELDIQSTRLLLEEVMAQNGAPLDDERLFIQARRTLGIPEALGALLEAEVETASKVPELREALFGEAIRGDISRLMNINEAIRNKDVDFFVANLQGTLMKNGFPDRQQWQNLSALLQLQHGRTSVVDVMQKLSDELNGKKPR